MTGTTSRIERFHSHLCRHTFATEWREAGGSRNGTKNGTELPTLEAKLVRREGIEPSTY
jgi:hypothetical protein